MTDLLETLAEIAALKARLRLLGTPRELAHLRNEHILADLLAGATRRVVAMKYGVIYQTVMNVARSHERATGTKIPDPSVLRNESILAALLSGTTKLDVTEQFGVSPATVARISARHRRETGTRLPSSRHRTGLGPRDPERDLAVVHSYLETGRMHETGVLFGLTSERVRQIVLRYERRTGTVIPHTSNRGEKVPRAVLTCPVCGKTKRTTQPEKTSSYCKHCGRANRIPDEKIDAWIARRRAGDSWLQIVMAAGMKINESNRITIAVAARLAFHRRHAELRELWPRGLPPYLAKRVPAALAAFESSVE